MSSNVSLSDFRPSGLAFTGIYGRYKVFLTPFDGEWEWEIYAEVSGPSLARGREFSLPTALDALFRRLAQGIGGSK